MWPTDKKPTATEISESRERLKAAYQQEEAETIKPCPLAGSPEAPPHGGKCCKCSQEKDVSHTIPRSNEALAEAERLKEFLDKGENLNVKGTEIAKLKDDGSMFGVLVCVDSAGNKVVLKAFSGGFDGTDIKDVPGWSGPVRANGDEEKRLRDNVYKEKTAREVKIDRVAAIGRELESGQAQAEKQNEDYKPELARIGQLGLRADEWKALGYDKPPADLTKESEAYQEAYQKVAAILYKPLADKQKAEWTAWQKRKKELETERTNLQKDLERKDKATGLNTYENALAKQRDYLAKNRKIQNYKGEEASIMDACCPKDDRIATNGQMAACAAPKLLAEAKALGLVPVSLAEFWYGKPTLERKHKEYYESCQYCRSILGFALCGLPEAQKKLETSLVVDKV